MLSNRITAQFPVPRGGKAPMAVFGTTPHHIYLTSIALKV
jgi:hypothetical protein